MHLEWIIEETFASGGFVLKIGTEKDDGKTDAQIQSINQTTGSEMEGNF